MAHRMLPALALAIAAAGPAAAAPGPPGSHASPTGGAAKALVARCGPLHGGEAAKRLTLDVAGLDELALVASGYSWGQAVWGEPVLVGRDGTTTKLTEL